MKQYDYLLDYPYSCEHYLELQSYGMLCMPPVAAAAVAGLAGGIGVTAAGALTFSLTSALIAGVSSLVLSGLSSALAPDSPSLDAGSFNSIKSRGITRQVRQSVTERRVVYGEQRVSGPLALISSTENNKYLHMVVMLASHEVESIDEIFVNDVSVPNDHLDGDGTVNAGRFKNRLRIKKHLGATGQTADSDLVSEVSEWTSDHRLRNIAYIYVRLRWNRDTYPDGIPNFSAWVKGKKVLDTRDSGTRYTSNIALLARDNLTDDRFGLRVDAADADTTELDATANTCDEFVGTTAINDTIEEAETTNDTITLTGVNDRLQYQTGDRVQLTGGSLPGGLSAATNYYVIAYQRKDTPRIQLATTLANALAGTAITITTDGTGTISKNAEPRYHGGGVIKANADRDKNYTEILSGMAGQSIYAGGVHRIIAGEYQTPTLSFDTTDLRGPIKIQPKVGRSDRFNIVQGIYASPLNDNNTADYPAVENATYLSNDNDILLKKALDLPFTPRPHTAQRIAKIDMERSRQEIVFTAQFSLAAFKLQVGDNFQYTEARYGWTNKVFEVIDWQLSISDLVPTITMTVRENASAVYDWNNGEETTVDPAQDTELPDPFTVLVVGGFSLDSVLVFTEDQDKTYKVIASWTDNDNEFVQSGGRYELEFKRSSEAESQYKSLAKVDGTVTSIQIPQLEPDVLYDIRIFAYNNLDVRSAANEITEFTVGSTVATETEDWENITEPRDGDDWENDALTSEDWEA